MDTPSPENAWARGCVLAVGIGAVVLAGGGYAGWRWYDAREAAARAEAEARAQSEFQPQRRPPAFDRAEQQSAIIDRSPNPRPQAPEARQQRTA